MAARFWTISAGRTQASVAFFCQGDAESGRAMRRLPNSRIRAVLVCSADMSQAKDQEYFSERPSWPRERPKSCLPQLAQLRVVARTSSFSFKWQRDVDCGGAIGRKPLKVAHV
jgi:hypothetical protein